KQGKTLIDVLNEIYSEFGIYYCQQDNFYFEGSAGMDKMNKIILSLQANPPKQIAGFSVKTFIDYAKSIKTTIATNAQEIVTLPKSDVLVFNLENGCDIIIRPSGTEPKIKAYYTAIAETLDNAQKIHNAMAQSMKEIMQ
ncbi:MAG: phospho-sugar mutase, partial [Oscillospiraceae bacterium]